MSPEQALCQAVDARSDIFSAGVVMYEMLSGHRPFTAPGLAATIDQIINNAPSPLGAVGVPPVLEAILQKCLKKQPALRFQSAAALNTALEAVSSKLDLGVDAHIPRRRSSGLHDEHLDEAGGGMTITMEYPCVAPTLAERR
jgi:serine/threonine protein kinase